MRPSLEFYYNKAPPIIFPDYETNSFLLLKGQATAPHSFSVFWANWDSYALKKKRLAYSVCVYAGTESSLKGARAAKPKVLSNLTNRNIDNIDSGGWLSYRLYSYSIAFYQSWYFTPLQSPHYNHSIFLPIQRTFWVFRPHNNHNSPDFQLKNTFKELDAIRIREWWTPQGVASIIVYYKCHTSVSNLQKCSERHG